jgi:hypothetical protein
MSKRRQLKHESKKRKRQKVVEEEEKYPDTPLQEIDFGSLKARSKSPRDSSSGKKKEHHQISQSPDV